MSKKSKKKIIAWLVSSTTLVSGATAGGIVAVTEIETKSEEEKKKHLAIMIPSNKRNLGKVYIGPPTTTFNDTKKIKEEIRNILVNKYNIDINSIVVEINNSLQTAIITAINADVYLGSVTLNYHLDTSVVTLDYIVPDIKTRYQQVASFWYSHHQDILTAKNDLLNDDEFNQLPIVDEFINELNTKIKYKASNESLHAFKKIEKNNDNFKDFADLNKQFNDHHLLFNGQINFASFIKTISDYWNNYNRINYQQIDIKANTSQLKRAMCRFYNILAQVYGKNNVFKMLQKIEFNQQLQEQTNGIVRKSFCWFL